MRNYFKFLLMFIWFASGYILPAASQQAASEASRNVLGAIQTMEVVYPQQKVYLHTDKDEYIAGESIWVKGYVVSSTTHLPDTMKANLYMEIINNYQETVNVVLLHSENGIAHGRFDLQDSLPEGNYLVRAYTNWMYNFSPALFFEKEIFVRNPIEENYIRRRQVRQNRSLNRDIEAKMEEMQFHVFPEGGDLVAGLENRVAFKASNSLGHYSDASGELVASGGNKVAEFKSLQDGMGVFSFTPQKGVQYQAKVTFENGQKKTVDLPQVKEHGYILKTDIGPREIMVQVKASSDTQAMADFSSEVFVLGQTRSRAYFMENAVLNNGEYSARIPLNILPSGVCQITLFDASGRPLAERLVFVNHNDMLPVEIATRNLKVDDQQALEVDVTFDVDEYSASQASYSLSVVSSENELQPAKSNIASYLLMTSDLEKQVNSPWKYLSDDSPEMQKAMDLVMMTNGWRRFDWDKILAGNYPEINFRRASGLTIAGEVKPTSSGRPTGEIAVEMVVRQDGRNVHTTTTDPEGNFFFSDLFFNDYFVAEFAIPRDPTNRNLRIGLHSRDFRESEYTRSLDLQPTSVVSRGDDWERVKQPETSLRSRWQERSAEPAPIYGNADQVIFMQDLQTHYSTVYDVLRSRATGFMVHDGQVMLRGPSSVNLSSEPLYVIDGVTAQRQVFFNLPPADLDRIEILKGSAAAIYGVRGTNGVILAFTKRGGQESLRTVDYMLIGFQSPREFSASNFSPQLYQQYNIDKTIFWEPKITPNGDGNASVMFALPPNAGNLRIVLEGIDNNGKVAFQERLILQ